MGRTITRYLDGGALVGEDLRELRPVKIGRADERFAVPQIRELRGTPFELCSDEVSFVTGMLDGHRRLGLRKHNVIVFRADQRRFCGDFVCVDVSAPPRTQGDLRLPSWDVFVLDLKRGAPLQVGGGGAGIQLRNAVDAADVAHRVVAARHVGEAEASRLGWQRFIAPRAVWLLVGDRAELLAFFRHLRLMRRAARRDDQGQEGAAAMLRQLLAERSAV